MFGKLWLSVCVRIYFLCPYRALGPIMPPGAEPLGMAAKHYGLGFVFDF